MMIVSPKCLDVGASYSGGFLPVFNRLYSGLCVWLKKWNRSLACGHFIKVDKMLFWGSGAPFHDRRGSALKKSFFNAGHKCDLQHEIIRLQPLKPDR